MTESAQQVEVHPIDWMEWSTRYSKNTASWTRTPVSTTEAIPPAHDLREMGETSNGYKYTVYYKGEHLLSATIRPRCCECLDKCPVGRDTVRLNPCRQHLRDEAKRMAYELWVQYMRDLGACYVPGTEVEDEY